MVQKFELLPSSGEHGEQFRVVESHPDGGETELIIRESGWSYAVEFFPEGGQGEPYYITVFSESGFESSPEDLKRRFNEVRELALNGTLEYRKFTFHGEGELVAKKNILWRPLYANHQNGGWITESA